MVEQSGRIRGPELVGRERELTQLRACLDHLTAGHGGIVAIGGEAGIGKTRLAQSFVDEVKQTGATIIQGHCYEGDWAAPYGPWQQALQSSIEAIPTPDLINTLGPWGAVLISADPHLRDRWPVIDSPESSQPDDELRFRMHEAATRFILHLASARPLIIVLEDLQWADRSSLDLLSHLARDLEAHPVLVIATYRDNETGTSHPLTATLAQVRRRCPLTTVALTGLDTQAVTSLASTLVERDLGPVLTREICRETAGNAFYVLSILHHLRDSGAVGSLRAPTSIQELGIPPEVRDLVALRIARLSHPARDLVDRASVFTGGIDFITLQAVSGLPELDLLDLLDLLLAEDVFRPVPERAETYEFSHAIVRQAVYDSHNPSRNARFHRQAAEAMERAMDRGEPWHAAELAIQYRGSAAMPGAERGVPHAVRAATDAQQALDRERAVGFFQIAADLGRTNLPTNRADVLRQLAVAQAEAMQFAQAATSAQQAISLLQGNGAEPMMIAGLIYEVAAALKSVLAPSDAWQSLITQGLAILGDNRSLTWARLVLLRDPIVPLDGPLRAATWSGFDPEAVAIARSEGDEDDYARTLETFDPRTPEETSALIELGRRWQEPTAALRALTVAANDLQYRHGAFRNAIRLWEELLATAERVGALHWQAQALQQLTLLYVALGDFVRARQLEQEAIERFSRLGPDSGVAAFRSELAASLAIPLDGEDWNAIAADLEDVTVALPTEPLTFDNLVTGLNGIIYAGLAALAHARAGNPERARWFCTTLMAAIDQTEPVAVNQGHNGAVAFAMEALWILDEPGDRELIGRYQSVIEALIEGGIGDYPQTSLVLSRARALVLLGEPCGEAFAATRTRLERDGQAPLLAIATLDEAWALVRVGEDPERAQLLAGQAEGAMRELGMTGWTRRAQSTQEKAQVQPADRVVFPAGLSEREVDVLRLIARGYSDRQVSDELFIALRTANAHVHNMLTKTGLSNRTELSVWAVDQGLVSRESG